jgi:N utilization substance protein A
MVALGRHGVKSLEDFADLAADELVEMLKDAVPMDEATAGDLILQARLVLGWIEPEPEPEPEIEPEGDAASAEANGQPEPTH